MSASSAIAAPRRCFASGRVPSRSALRRVFSQNRTVDWEYLLYINDFTGSLLSASDCENRCANDLAVKVGP